MYSFPNLEPVCCSMSSSNCCFLTCKQISQKTGQVVWYSHLFKNFPQFLVIHTVQGFGIVNKAEGIFLELSCFFDDPMDVGNLISGSSEGKARKWEALNPRLWPLASLYHPKRKIRLSRKMICPKCCVSLPTMLGPELTFSDFQFVLYYFAMNC